MLLTSLGPQLNVSHSTVVEQQSVIKNMKSRYKYGNLKRLLYLFSSSRAQGALPIVLRRSLIQAAYGGTIWLFTQSEEDRFLSCGVCHQKMSPQMLWDSFGTRLPHSV